MNDTFGLTYAGAVKIVILIAEMLFNRLMISIIYKDAVVIN